MWIRRAEQMGMVRVAEEWNWGQEVEGFLWEKRVLCGVWCAKSQVPEYLIMFNYGSG